MPRDDNTVYIGSKPTINYVLAVLAQFNTSPGDIKVKARGKSISTAVDVVEIVRNRYAQDVVVRDVQISTEPLKRHDGSMANVSSIEISLGKE